MDKGWHTLIEVSYYKRNVGRDQLSNLPTAALFKFSAAPTKAWSICPDLRMRPSYRHQSGKQRVKVHFLCFRKRWFQILRQPKFDHHIFLDLLHQHINHRNSIIPDSCAHAADRNRLRADELPAGNPPTIPVIPPKDHPHP